MVTVLHDLNLTVRYAAEILLLYRGRPVAQGPVAAVLTPENIELAFGIEVELLPHPGEGFPLIIKKMG